MPVSVVGGPREKLHVTGDIEAVLPLPYDPDDERFSLTFSDGTLVEGTYDECGVYRFALAVEGAGMVRIERGKPSDRLSVDWAMEWVTVATYRQSARRIAASEPMPLFPELERPVPEPSIDPMRLSRVATMLKAWSATPPDDRSALS